MNSKEIALLIFFIACSLSLHPMFSGFAIPSFAPTRWFQFWEIPVFAALLLFGIKFALTIAALDTITVLILFGGEFVGFTTWFSFIPLFGTLIGIHLSYRFFTRKNHKNHLVPKGKEIIFSVASGLLFRFLLGYPAFYVMLKYLIQLPDPVIFVASVQNVIHDIIFVSYSVPLGYLLEEIIQKNLKMAIKTDDQ